MSPVSRPCFAEVFTDGLTRLCGIPTRNQGGRCDDHVRHQAYLNPRRVRPSASARGYGRGWQKVRAAAIAAHVATYGPVCPGYQVAAHPSRDLTGDHIVPLVRGGQATTTNAVAVLCRACNSRRGSKVARP